MRPRARHHEGRAHTRTCQVLHNDGLMAMGTFQRWRHGVGHDVRVMETFLSTGMSCTCWTRPSGSNVAPCVTCPIAKRNQHLNTSLYRGTLLGLVNDAYLSNRIVNSHRVLASCLSPRSGLHRTPDHFPVVDRLNAQDMSYSRSFKLDQHPDSVTRPSCSNRCITCRIANME